MRKDFTLGLFILPTLLLLVGCAAPKERPRLFWPVSSDPKLEWIGTFASNDDFPKTAAQKRLESVVGKQVDVTIAKPMGIAADGRGKVYVADGETGNVRVWDFNTQHIDFLRKEPFARLPNGLTMDSAGRLYVADGAGKVLVFGADGAPLRSFGDPSTLGKPAFLALNERLGRLYVSDSTRHRVAVFDLDGQYLFSFGEGPSGQEGKLFGPQGLAVAPDDKVFVADYFNARVQAFDADGNFSHTFGERGDLASQFEGPKDIAFDGSGHLYILDVRKATLSVYDADGTFLLHLGGGRSGHPLGFAFPNAIFIDRNDRIYVSDMLNKRFAVWQFLTPAYLKEHPVTQADLDRMFGVVREAEEEQKRKQQEEPKAVKP